MNLIKFIASSGAASRRKAEELIRAAHVTVNGSTVTDPACKVSENDQVFLDGRQLFPEEKFYYILLHKPRSYVCSSADRHAEKLAVDLLKSIPARLVSAGRLDKDSEGAIIFSNDGNFINFLAHPRYGVLKTYIVHTASPLAPEDLLRIQQGIADGSELLKAESVRQLGKKRYEFILNEGKKREIRRLTAACGAPTKRLIRIKIGTVELGTLPAGSFRELSAAEISSLRGVNHE